MKIRFDNNGTDQDAALGMKRYVAVAADATANTVDITLDAKSPVRPFVQIWRSNVLVTADANVSVSGTTVTVANGGLTYALTAGDEIIILYPSTN